MDMNFLAKDN